jgi:hypothetical protein
MRKRSVTIFGVSHQVQGVTKAKFRQVADPSYAQYAEEEIRSGQFDFVFEEATELGPTIAERLSAKALGEGHYLDVDPHPDNRQKFGIASIGEYPTPINPCEPGNTDIAHGAVLEVHAKREELWVNRMKAQPFRSALFICGYLHTLSVAFRLQAAGFCVPRAAYYMPHNRLCTLPHA